MKFITQVLTWTCLLSTAGMTSAFAQTIMISADGSGNVPVQNGHSGYTAEQAAQQGIHLGDWTICICNPEPTLLASGNGTTAPTDNGWEVGGAPPPAGNDASGNVVVDVPMNAEDSTANHVGYQVTIVGYLSSTSSDYYTTWVGFFDVSDPATTRVLHPARLTAQFMAATYHDVQSGLAPSLEATRSL